MLKIGVKNIQQTEEFPCGPNSLYMISSYLGYNFSKSEILQKFKNKTDKINRVIMPIIAEVALEMGLDFQMIITNYTYFPYELNKLNNKELLEYIEKKIRSSEKFIDIGDKKYYLSVKRFIQNGGKVEFKLFTLKDIEELIIKKNPCLCQINTASFSKKDIDYKRQHFVVINGFTKREFIINIGHEKYVEKNKEDFLFSLYRPKIPNILLFN